MQSFLAQIIKLLPGLWAWVGAKTKPASPPGIIQDPEAWQRARRYFVAELAAFLPGRIEWKSGVIKKDGEQLPYSMILHTRENGEYLRQFVDWSFDSMSVPNWHKTLPGSPSQYNRAGGGFVTWCNQAASLWAIEYLGIDLDFENKDGKKIEYGANGICENFESGYYNCPEFRVMPATQDEAIEAADFGGLAFCTLYKPGKIGHIAVVEPGGALVNAEGNKVYKLSLIQAGRLCGEHLSFNQCFGASNAEKVKFWIVKK